jgi:Flp pilus assembly protein TadG
MVGLLGDGVEKSQSTIGSRRRQWGAAAVEFALVFPILFMLMYGIVVYAYVFVVQQSLQYAAQEAAEAAVKVSNNAGNADALRASHARLTAARVLRWMPVNQQQRVIGDSSGSAVRVEQQAPGCAWCPPDSHGFRVTLEFKLNEPGWLFPVLNLPLVGAVPPLPEVLRASAVVRI